MGGCGRPQLQIWVAGLRLAKCGASGTQRRRLPVLDYCRFRAGGEAVFALWAFPGPRPHPT
eukprot:1519547-Alexandrium_andersonii.AAC.1